MPERELLDEFGRQKHTQEKLGTFPLLKNRREIWPTSRLLRFVKKKKFPHSSAFK